MRGKKFMQSKFVVKGMSCTACSGGIERNLSTVEGISSVSVQLLGETMVVEHDENIVSVDDICAKVKALGYSATLHSDTLSEDKVNKIDKVLVRFCASLVFLLGIMYLCMGGGIGLPQPSDMISYTLQLILTTIVLIINGKFFVNGTRAVLNKSANMDTLVALSSGAAYLCSVVVTIMYYSGASIDGHLFYESAAMVVTLVTLGKWLEDKSKRQTGREIDRLSKIVPKRVTVLREGQEKVIDTTQVVVGDIVVLRMGDYVAVDGVIVEGSSFVDSSAITGESLAVECTVDDSVVSGSIVRSGYLHVRADKVGANTLFSKIIESVRIAGETKAPIQKFVDRVAGVFVPVVLLISVVTFVVWIILSGDFFVSFNYAISVLVISCPCALGLATPVAIIAATGKGASLGVLYKDAEAIQKTNNIDCVILDKTATITRGKPRVVAVEYFVEEQLVNRIASAIENNSNHPLAECIKDYVGTSIIECKDYQYIVGQGVVATIGSTQYRLGNSTLVAGVDNKRCEEMLVKYDNAGNTTIFLASDIAVLAVFAIADTVKKHSQVAIKNLNDHGILTIMATGDNEGAAASIAKQVGISQYIAGVMPADKQVAVQQYQAQGYHVSMVGDGINDSPAIKSADLGIAMGTGTDVAIDSADIVIAGGSLRGVCNALSLGKRTNAIIKGNLFWAFIYNCLAIPVAAGALTAIGVILTPTISATCMCLSSLFVVTNALRINRYKPIFVPNDKSADAPCIVATITVEGMMCEHCVAHVTEALMAVAGVTNVSIDLETKSVVISSTVELDSQVIVDAVVGAGYRVV